MRSLLYVPGDQPDKLAKAPGCGADALIADLEDAVGPERKEDGRATVAEWLRSTAPQDGPQLWVRVNGGALLDADVRAVVTPRVHGVLLPKASRAEVERLDGILGTAETKAGLPRGSVAVSALVETAAGVVDAVSIAHSPRVVRLAIGEADLGAELGIEPSDDGREWVPVRMQIVLASAAAGIEPPVGPISTDFRDLDALRASTTALKRMGFGSRSAIHPAQVPVINEVYTPTADEIGRARRVMARFEESRGGVTTDDDGRMIDEALVRAARRTIAQAAGT